MNKINFRIEIFWLLNENKYYYFFISLLMFNI